MASPTKPKAPKVEFFQYNAQGIYIGPVSAHECPENATELVPPANGDENVSAYFNGTEWRLIPNLEIATKAATRARRDDLLRESDYTQLADFKGDAKAWAEYRQSLRDLPAQKDFPATIEWPAKPKAVAVVETPKK